MSRFAGLTVGDTASFLTGLFTAMVMTDAYRTFFEDHGALSTDARQQKWNECKSNYVADAFDWALRYFPEPLRSQLMQQRETFVDEMLRLEFN